MVENNLTIDVVVPIYIAQQSNLGMSLRCLSRAKEMTNIKYKTIIVETCSNYMVDHADIHIYEKERTNATKSINRGFFCCDSDYTVLLTNDVMVNEGWLESLIEPFIRYSDCGVTTLGSTQFGHTKRDVIEEGIWGSVFMLPTEYAEFDTNYVNSWDDSDLWMQIYTRGYKMYRNFNCIAEHNPGQTHYCDPEHNANYDKNREYFEKKWINSNIPLYQILTKGYVV